MPSKNGVNASGRGISIPVSGSGCLPGGFPLAPPVQRRFPVAQPKPTQKLPPHLAQQRLLPAKPVQPLLNIQKKTVPPHLPVVHSVGNNRFPANSLNIGARRGSNLTAPTAPNAHAVPGQRNLQTAQRQLAAAVSRNQEMQQRIVRVQNPICSRNAIMSIRNRSAAASFMASQPSAQKLVRQPQVPPILVQTKPAMPVLVPRQNVQFNPARKPSLHPNYRLPQPYPGPRVQPQQSARAEDTVQPMLLAGLAIAGTVGALYAGYRYYRHRRRENVIDRIRQEHATHIGNINSTTEGHGGVGVTSYARTVNHNIAAPGRTYDVYINLDDPVGSGGTSGALVESARIHERTHISADQAYSANVPGVSQDIYHTAGGGYAYHSYPIHDRAETLLAAIAGDNALTLEQRTHLRNRVKKNSVKPIEWDSTINELLVYTRQVGISANSRTVKLLVQYANENLQHRQGTLIDLPRLRPHLGNAYHLNQETWPLIFQQDQED